MTEWLLKSLFEPGGKSFRNLYRLAAELCEDKYVASIGQVKTRLFFQKKDDFFYKTGRVFIKLDSFL